MSDGPLLLDTSGWLLAVAGVSPFAEALASARPAIIPGLVLAEVDWHLRFKRPQMRRLLEELVAGAYVYEPATVSDLDRAAQIDAKFRNLRLGLVDASIAAVAERLGVHRLLTADRDFLIVRIGSSWTGKLEMAVPVENRPRG